MMQTQLKGRVLVVAGSDSSGGAGLQADVKTLTAHGVYAATAVTALTVQDTQDVYAVHETPSDVITGQIEKAMSDIGADVVKTGMLGGLEACRAVIESLQKNAADVPWVVDPVMVSTSGVRLMDEEAINLIKAELIRYADIITPNIPEAEALTGLTIQNDDDLAHAAEMLLTLGSRAVLVKGGHMRGDTIIDFLATDEGEFAYPGERLETQSTHGTGCTLASAIAAGLAQGHSVKEAVERARLYVRTAIRTAPGYGAGAGPLNHVCNLHIGE
ncbi:MAG: bifunctional hydroxymethylpyrimidine kinase/phosphomethylpyrimidine kinase [Pseudomonadota bacterium]